MISADVLRDEAREVKRLGHDAGFDLVRIGPASDLHSERLLYLEWVRQGRHGEMRWINPAHAMRSTSPGVLLPEARSVVSVAIQYGSGLRPATPDTRGRVARYAWGDDYHRVIGERLELFAHLLEEAFGGSNRWYVDTGPAMDKALAARSGLGWYGKNSNILTEKFGSYVLLGEIISTLDLPPDPALDRDCGSCRLCVVACPTGAISPEYSVDSRKCISYLTIEHRGPIPLEFRGAIGNWVFGCDICQDVCPPTAAPYLSSPTEKRAWASEVREYVSRSGHRERAGTEAPAAEIDHPDRWKAHPLFQQGMRPDVDLLWLLRLSHDEYLDAFRGSSIRRAKVWMLRRNAAIALGNVGGKECIEALRVTMQSDENPVVRGHAAWAIGQISRRVKLSDSGVILATALDSETDNDVRGEIASALASL